MSEELFNVVTAEMWSAVESGAGGGRAAPCARGKHSATLLGGHVYVLGGRGAGGSVPLRDFWRYSLASGAWERLESRGEAPSALQEHSATAHRGRLYVFGGEAGALNNETPLWIYDTETQVWRKLPGQAPYPPSGRRRAVREPRGAGAGPRGRRGHSAHALKDCLLIYGGYRDLRGSTNELWAFHYESESWHLVRTGNAGPARHRHAGALHDARLYVHAGQCDLRACSDLWHYDTMSRVWCQVRPPTKLSPGPRAGHAAARAGAHLYIFGGDAHGQAANDMWRFHFASETWERVVPSVKWPPARVDGCALLVPAAPPLRSPPPPPPPPPRRPPVTPQHGLLREISKLSSFHIRRAARCSYSALAGDKDSTESLVRQEAALSKSHSAYIIDKRQPPDGCGAGGESPREGDVPEFRSEMCREPISVPDFADMTLPTPPPVLSPVEATKLVYLECEQEQSRAAGARVALPKSASVRFTQDTLVTDEEDTDLSTSDYASAEKVNRLSGVSLGFSNPHYLGPDVRNLGQALTPDSGVGAGDIELQDLGQKRGQSVPRNGNGEIQLHLLLVGGKEPPHVALLQSPISMWTYRLL